MSCGEARRRPLGSRLPVAAPPLGRQRPPPLPRPGPLLRWAPEGGGGRGLLGVGGVPRGSSCLPLEDVGGRLPVFLRGGGEPRVPRQVLHHRSGPVEPFCTKGAFDNLRGPPRWRECYSLADGDFRCRVEGQVCHQDCVRRECAASGRRLEDSWPWARTRGCGWLCLAQPPVATPPSMLGRFGGRACRSTAGRGRLGASGTPWLQRPGGARGQRGAAPPLATLLPLRPWRGP